MADSKELFKFTLSGPWAIIAIILMAVYGAYHIHTINGALESPLIKEQITNQIKGHYMGIQAKDMLEQHEAGELEDGAEWTPVDITLNEMELRGLFSDRQVIRVKPMVNGEPPPDGKEYWYFETEYSSLLGWQIPLPVGEWAWSLKWF